MKRTIEHKTYNTDTAELIFTYESEGIQKYTESMYRRKQGEYFLYGKGMGKYGHYYYLKSSSSSHYMGRGGSCAVPGEKIIPMSDAEAKQWLKDHENLKK